eukprot:2791298-Rhodomonas_salina.1
MHVTRARPAGEEQSTSNAAAFARLPWSNGSMVKRVKRQRSSGSKVKGFRFDPTPARTDITHRASVDA